MKSKKILVVDDDEAIVELLQELFTEEGFEVKISIDGQALKTAPQFQPDLILLDVLMPLMDGIEVSRGLKADPATRHIPIILFSANAKLKELDTTHVESFIAKPFDITELLDQPFILDSNLAQFLLSRSVSRSLP